MGYIEKIQSDLTAAMKEKDELRLSVLRMVKSALKLKEIDKMRPLDDLESLQILQTLSNSARNPSNSSPRAAAGISRTKKPRKSPSSKNICLPLPVTTKCITPSRPPSPNPAPTP